ncbi:hypothetical protein BC939DRAFT_531488 [Gamsiella multidivaricata]|uniref:uncharacterized protein n=1 Tax=Gamsiella multidivaricata TaxID=101098 RepID=UPI00221E3910|nr:uncharacterized protein BC939DRAFT_531488 [Gamsiella multidivaricata]KAG0369906.1 hypothetical protein BGZ54_008475 [Gamsiella multidivaricata]KAI7819156.1 hypothetical protein BC939DRAFT_531488 [Gamsiella multidivaricata]
MAEEDQNQLEWDANGGGEYYNEDGEGEEYEEQDNENETEDEDGNDVQIGEEVELSHTEVWDDSALIEAWDAAVRQYEQYHSKTGAREKIESSSTQAKSKNKAEQLETPSVSPFKRMKLGNGGPTNARNGIPVTAEKDMLQEDSAETKSEQESSNGQTQSNGTSTRDAVTERKPSFRKADKPNFNHHKSRQVEGAKRSNISTSTSASNSTQRTKAKAETPTAEAATLSAYLPVDAATIAYYQQLGYYYDPSYEATQAAKTGDGKQEQQGLEYGAPRSSRAQSSTPNATTSKSSAHAKNRPPAGSSSGPAPQSAPFGSSAMPMFPHHASQHGYYAGYPPHIPFGAAAHGGFAIPGPSGATSPWGVGVAPMPFGPGSGPVPAGRHYPPPPTMPFPLPPLPGQLSVSGMDDDSLSNLIMAWYFSGYYTGLYQAQRR